MGKVAIVTGAARGIGAATALRLAADGLAVAVLDLDESACADTVRGITDAGGTAIAVGANVADTNAVTAAVSSGMGPLWVTVAPVGIVVIDIGSFARVPFQPSRRSSRSSVAIGSSFAIALQRVLR